MSSPKPKGDCALCGKLVLPPAPLHAIACVFTRAPTFIPPSPLHLLPITLHTLRPGSLTPGMAQVTGADERWQQADGRYVHKACGLYQKIHFGVCVRLASDAHSCSCQAGCCEFDLFVCRC